MIQLKKTFFIYMLFSIVGCKTYTTFYGVTDTLGTFHKNTKRLNLSHQNLQTVPSKMHALEKLKMLDISGNTNLDISKVLSALPHPEELEVLILDSLHLKALPDNMALLKNLKQLSLGYNADLNLEDTFNQLSKIPLDFLNLKGNNIQQLPKNIQQLTTLKDLNLSYNQLHDTNSYTYLAKLPELYSLWLDHNAFTEIPKTLGLLEQISYLYIDHNALTTLPETLSGMKNLRVLHAGYNKFAEFPEQFIKMPKLIMVHINNNQITRFPRAYATEKYALLSLVLDNNPISEAEQQWVEKTFQRFFSLSFSQRY